MRKALLTGVAIILLPVISLTIGPAQHPVLYFWMMLAVIVLAIFQLIT